jgi:hypothetical protein
MSAARTGRTHDCTRPGPKHQKHLDPRGPSTHATEIFLQGDLESAFLKDGLMKQAWFTEDQIIGV